VLPEIFVLTAGCLAQTRFLVAGLQVDEKRMRANLDITKGLIVSEAVMMGLGPHLGRQYAHDLVYDVCRQVVATGRPLAELLAENKEIAKHMSKAELQKLCDPANYLGQAGEMVDRVLALRQRG
jgi:3-carboxy-cis,cis-muconate cycloisomerase